MANRVSYTRTSNGSTVSVDMPWPSERDPLKGSQENNTNCGDSKPGPLKKIKSKDIVDFAKIFAEGGTIETKCKTEIERWEEDSKGKLLIYFISYCTEDGKDKDINETNGEELKDKDKNSDIFYLAVNISDIEQQNKIFKYLWRECKGNVCKDETVFKISDALKSLCKSFREDNLTKFKKQWQELHDPRRDKTWISLMKDLMFDDLLLGSFTLLQYACKHGKLDFAECLIACGFDINYAPISKQKPIQLACKNGHPEILKLLINKGTLTEGQDPIRSTKHQTLFSQAIWNFVPPENSTECLKILIDYTNTHPNIKSIGNVNAKDQYGRTPLHYAVMRKNDPCILLLLKNGARMDVRDNFEEMPLSNMPASAFQKFLDGMISFNDYKSRSKDKNNESYDLQFDFRDIFQKEINENDSKPQYTFSMGLLKKIKREKHLRKVISHPIISIIIHFQNYRIRQFFYWYLGFYFLFLSLYTPYVVLQGAPQNFTNVTSAHLKEKSENLSIAILPLFILSFIILLGFTLLEIVKIFRGISYISSLDNLIRFITISLSWAVLVKHRVDKDEDVQLKAVSILMVCFEFFLVFSKYPRLTYYIFIFRSASLKLIKFLIFHAIILIGFALSFHILFRKSEEKQAEIFQKFSNATFKTIIMLTSEFDASEIPFYEYGVSHFIFVLYIFFITIVLFNNMIALALAKVNRIEKNKLLYKSYTEIDMIVHFEEYYLESRNKWHEALQRLLRSFFRFLKEKFSRTEEKLVEEEVQILKVKGNKLLQSIKFETYPKKRVVFIREKKDDLVSNNSCCNWCKCSRGIFKYCQKFFSNQLSEKVMLRAREIATKNRQQETNENLS